MSEDDEKAPSWAWERSGLNREDRRRLYREHKAAHAKRKARDRAEREAAEGQAGTRRTPG